MKLWAVGQGGVVNAGRRGTAAQEGLPGKLCSLKAHKLDLWLDLRAKGLAIAVCSDPPVVAVGVPDRIRLFQAATTGDMQNALAYLGAIPRTGALTLGIAFAPRPPTPGERSAVQSPPEGLPPGLADIRLVALYRSPELVAWDI